MVHVLRLLLYDRLFWNERNERISRQHRVSHASLFKRVLEKAEQWLLACLYNKVNRQKHM